jgi:probable HAF family extracellular repeat protein
MHDLGTLGGTLSVGNAINDAGTIVGESTNSAGQYQAFIDSGGRMVNLNSLLTSSAAQMYTLISGIAINDAGEILASGHLDSAPSSLQYFLLNASTAPPVPLPPALVLLLSGIGGLGVMARGRRASQPVETLRREPTLSYQTPSHVISVSI